jgi:hypothetical protein
MYKKLLFSLLALLPNAAFAFCGFYVGGASSKMYNNATQVVMMRDGTRTVLAMQNNYQGPTEKFAMVIPVPVILQKENVKTLTKDVFERIDTLDAPRLVEYWEQDPCRPMLAEAEIGGAGVKLSSASVTEEKPADLGVKIEAQFTVAEYEIVILSAKDSTGLTKWLSQEKYNIPEGAEPVLKPYVDGGMKFFAAKVDPTKVTFNSDGQAMLSPLRFHYDSETFTLPIRLGMLNAKDKQDLIVHILAKDRYEVTNYTNVFIPTNLEVAESVKENFGSFYAALFDATLEKYKDADGRNPVITEYAWAANTCDPCPGPALQPQDALILGGDVLPSFAEDIKNQNIWGLTNLTLTRLHARYDQTSLGEDLVFRNGAPMDGGREAADGDIKNDNDAKQAYANQFQGRYIIRHRWEGKIECQNPQRGIWGGPPDDPYGWSQPTAAKDLAFAKRDGVKLAAMLAQDVPMLGLSIVPQNMTGAAPSTSGEKKKLKPAGGSGPTQPSFYTPEPIPLRTPFNWGFAVAALGGLILLLIVASSLKRDKH